MLNHFFLIKKCLQELKLNNWKYLRDPTWTRVTNISRISCAICQLIGFLQWRAIFFPSWPGYWQLLRGRQYIPRLCLWAGQTTIFSTSSCERLNFPALAKMRSYSVTFVRERLQLLRWFLTSTTHLLRGTNSSLPREEPQVIFAIPAKEHLASAPAILVVCDSGGQWFANGYGLLWRMT